MQSGPWNVGFTGNTAANPLWIKDSENPARHPFALFGSNADQTNAGQPFLGVVMEPPVPNGQRYVVEHYEAQCQVLPSGTLTDLRMAFAVGDSVNFHPLVDHAVPHLVSSNSVSNAWSGSGNTHLYADPGAFLVVQAYANPSGVLLCQFSVSGYAVPLP